MILRIKIQIPRRRTTRRLALSIESRNRILFFPDELSPNHANQVILHDADERAQHIRHVLGHKNAGDEFLAGVMNLYPATATLLPPLPGFLPLALHPLPIPPSTLPPIHLLLAMPRPKVFRRLLAPLASLGIHSLVLVDADKTEAVYFGSHVLTREGIQAEVVRGLEQALDWTMPRVCISRGGVNRGMECMLHVVDGKEVMTHGAYEVSHLDRSMPPRAIQDKEKQQQEVLVGTGPLGNPRRARSPPPPTTLPSTLASIPRLPANTIGLVADPKASASLLQTLPRLLPSASNIIIAIGPEGGWTNLELDAFRAGGYEVVSVGSRCLTTETFAPLLVSLVRLFIEDG